uniref:Uncharacterized protein n=3 Tax=Enterobacteriaceae TaxID=543 RepID=A0A1I9W745_SALTM|nr:hypothetical protein KPH11_194 [Klebsiella pneumoniae subsp. pneumoniae]APA22996.1 hypothetical protein [Salmonella enterica subsp. enterica serovar Typhimurium]CDI45258.1 hypothetical protein [Escherichia coli R178]CED95383.1 hypothetical protein [Salmonella enterica subsp. enterica serovar Infantis]
MNSAHGHSHRSLRRHQKFEDVTQRTVIRFAGGRNAYLYFTS